MPTNFEPNTNPNQNKLDLWKYYRKGVVIVCPHQQFDREIFRNHFKCKCGANNLKTSGWDVAVICDIISASKIHD